MITRNWMNIKGQGCGTYFDPPAQGFKIDDSPTRPAPNKETRETLENFLNSLNDSGLFGTDADLAFLVLAEQIKLHNSNIKQMVGQIRIIARARELIGDQIAKLRKLYNVIKELNNTPDGRPDCHVYSLNHPKISPYKDLARKRSFLVDYDKLTVTVAIGDRGHISTRADKAISAAHVDTEIKHLEGLAQRLDSDREIRMVELNSLISKKGNLVQMLSNIDKKKNDTRGAVINNLR